METTKKVKTQRIKAGEVIYMEYQGDNKPCDKALAILLTPVTLKEDSFIGEFRTLYAFDTDKEKFIPAGPINGVKCKITVVKGKLKAWYYEQVVEMCKGNK